MRVLSTPPRVAVGMSSGTGRIAARFCGDKGKEKAKNGGAKSFHESVSLMIDRFSADRVLCAVKHL